MLLVVVVVVVFVVPVLGISQEIAFVRAGGFRWGALGRRVGQHLSLCTKKKTGHARLFLCVYYKLVGLALVVVVYIKKNIFLRYGDIRFCFFFLVFW